MTKDELKAWLRALLAGIVSRPNEIVIDVSNDDRGVLFAVRVGNGDAGRVIGKGGETIKNIRALLRYVGGLGNMRASLKLDAPAIRERAPFASDLSDLNI